MLKEMEVTGQAYEDKQEQNIRLVQQLKEKDDANFKLMSEVRIVPNLKPSIQLYRLHYIQLVMTFLHFKYYIHRNMW